MTHDSPGAATGVRAFKSREKFFRFCGCVLRTMRSSEASDWAPTDPETAAAFELLKILGHIEIEKGTGLARLVGDSVCSR